MLTQLALRSNSTRCWLDSVFAGGSGLSQMTAKLFVVAIPIAVLCSGATTAAQRVAENVLPGAPPFAGSALPAEASQLFWTSEEPHQAPQQPASRPNSDRGICALLKRGALDQKEIYTAPLHRRNLKWDALLLAATGGLIVGDKHVTGAISHANLSTSQHISDVGLYSTIATTGLLFLTGTLKKNEHARETGFLGLEALANTLAVAAVTQLITGRERPLESAGHGRFWVNNTVDSSFPSMHSGLTWSMTGVIAHEYPNTWVQFLAYGTATTVSVTRVTGLKHFPADVAVGGVFGYLIGQHIFHYHSRFCHARSENGNVP